MLVLHSFFHYSKFDYLMKIVDVMEKVFEVCTEKINVINKSFPNFLKRSQIFALDIAVRYNPAYKFLLWLKMLDLPLQRPQLIKLRIKSVPSGC